MVIFIWQLASFLFGFIVVVLLLTALIAFIDAVIKGVIKALKE